jgi:CBS domain-containing protein
VPCLAVHEVPAFTSALTVADAMRRDPVIVSPDATSADVAHALRTRGHRAAVVTDGVGVMGVVTTTDLLGSLVERLEQKAPPRLSRLLVAVSLAASPRRRCSMHTALDVALDITRRHGAMLTLLHVMRGLSLRVAEGLPAGVDADVQRWRLAEARAALASLVPREDRSMTRVDVRAGDVVEGVLNSAATMGAELIVMGGRPGAAVVRETIRRAPCPVLAA